MNQRRYFNEVAPRWDSLLDEESLAKLGQIVNSLVSKPNDTILDMGSGTGALISLLQDATGKGSRIIPLDISENMLQIARGKDFEGDINFIQADTCAIPLFDETCDLVMCYSVFPHFGDKPRALVELKRVLRPNGRLVICHTKSREEINEIHRHIGGTVAHDVLPDETEMRALLADAGLDRIEVSDEPDRYLAIARKSDGALMPDLEIARQILTQDALGFVIVKSEKVLASSREQGVRPFFDVIVNLEEALSRAAVADRVVGKAIALLSIYAGIDAVYAHLASKPAMKSLEEASIRVSAKQVVPHILNREGIDLCPFEKLMYNVSDPDEAFSSIKTFLGE